MKKINVFIADDHQILRESLVILLSQDPDIQVGGQAADGQEAFNKIRALKPDVAVLDISLPHLNGIDLAAKLRQELPEVRTVILTMHKSEDFVTRALAAGVRGYVVKENALEELIHCIKSVAAGKVYLSDTITELVVNSLVQDTASQGPGAEQLSTREREILQLLAEGASNKEISQWLSLSVKTVETHRANIMRKMGFRNITDLVLFAVRNHIIEP